MRLIDADRLRNIAISNRDIEMVYEIDHSPTVEAYIFEQVQDLVSLNKKLSEERPHGEWEHWGSPFTDDTIANSIVCTRCKARYVEIDGEVFNFCPNCGASMQANDRQVTGKLDDNTTLLYSMTNGDNFIGKEGDEK